MDNTAPAAGTMQPQHDGSIDGAVAVMPDFDDSNLISFEQARDGAVPQQRRDDQGRFAAEERRQQEAAEKAALDQARQPAPDKDAKAEEVATSAPEEEFFELPPDEEGGEPKRIPATEVFEGYQRAQELQAELEEMKRIAPPPQEYDRQIYETVQVRGRLMQDLQAYAQMLQPQKPNLELLNQASPNFNPDLYYQQVQMAEQMGQQLGAVRQQMQQLQADQSREQEALTQARFARERGKLQEIWPEILSDPREANKVRDVLAREFDIDSETLATTIDVRFYKLAKYAIAHLEGMKAQKSVAKIVRSKPKLVRASARSGESAKQQAISTAMRRHSSQNSLDSAADVIGGLLGS